MVFTARYLDLFTNYISLYNTCMKVRLCPTRWALLRGSLGPRLLDLREEVTGAEILGSEGEGAGVPGSWARAYGGCRCCELKHPPHPPPQVVYIACSFTTVWMIYSKFKATYDGNHDTFRVEFLVVPTAILAFLVNHDFTPLEVGCLGGPLGGGGAGCRNSYGQWSLKGLLLRDLLKLPYFRTKFIAWALESDDVNPTGSSTHCVPDAALSTPCTFTHCFSRGLVVQMRKPRLKESS